MLLFSVKLSAPHATQAIVHSLVHIESCAVDLSWDIIARFGSDPAYKDHLPKQFFDDFVEVAQDECRHFTLLAKRLEVLLQDLCYTVELIASLIEMPRKSGAVGHQVLQNAA